MSKLHTNYFSSYYVIYIMKINFENVKQNFLVSIISESSYMCYGFCQLLLRFSSHFIFCREYKKKFAKITEPSHQQKVPT